VSFWWTVGAVVVGSFLYHTCMYVADRVLYSILVILGEDVRK
jgi:hypothetical protein